MKYLMKRTAMILTAVMLTAHLPAPAFSVSAFASDAWPDETMEILSTGEDTAYEEEQLPESETMGASETMEEFPEDNDADFPAGTEEAGQDPVLDGDDAGMEGSTQEAAAPEEDSWDNSGDDSGEESSDLPEEEDSSGTEDADAEDAGDAGVEDADSGATSASEDGAAETDAADTDAAEEDDTDQEIRDTADLDSADSETAGEDADAADTEGAESETAEEDADTADTEDTESETAAEDTEDADTEDTEEENADSADPDAADEAGAEDPSGSGWSDGGTDAAETDAAQEETAGTDDSEASGLPAQTTEPDAAEGAETGAQIPEEISGEESAEQTVPADGFSEDEIPTDLVLIEDAEEEVYIPAKEEAAEADNDGLFAAYVNRELGLEGDLQADTGNSVAQERAAKSHYASTRLKENEKSIYGVLLRKIREVAAGESTSTQLTVTLKETGFAGKTWTAGELGVKQIVEYVDGNYKITEDAKAALKITLGNLNKALLADCPCDLYWYDKTKGVSCTHFRYGAAYIDGEYRIYYSGESKYSFTVSMDYRPLGGTDLYVTDTGIGESVRTARETALSIVDKYKNMSDYEKLDGYRKEICGLVSYNHAAINNDDTPYGDPWQLIWTFDGDQTTNVVCEGYSKSFQYLCDLTAWNDIFRECISVSGTMYGSGGGGRHMWNIVRLRDGSNFLADITNCDSGTVGAGNDGRSLFLVGTGDSAEYAGYASGNAADGYSFPGLSSSLRYVYDEEACDRFGEEFLALSPGRVTADTVAAGAYTGNHEHIFVPLEELPADCIHTGHSAGLQCAICGVFDDSVQYYPVTNVHSPGTWKVTKEPTYDEQGTETTSCTVCGRTLTRAVAKKEPAAQTFTVSGSSIPVFSTGRITINGTARGTVTYGSSNPSVAMVNRDSGEITAKAAGSATITVTAAGTKEFKARTQSTTVTVTALSLVADDVTVAADGLVYNGNAKTPAVTVKHGGRTLQSGTDYAVTYTNNTNAGTAKVTVTGKGNYKGSASRSFTIAKASQSVTAQAAAASVCAGRSTKLTVTGAKGEKTFSSSNTTIASVNSTTGQVTAKKVGTVSITVSCAATTNYKAASAKVTIKVLPAAVTSLKAENLAKGIKITWNRVAGANGYLIYRNDKKIRTISGGATLTYSDPNANTNGAKYIYKVVAKAATGTSTLSKSVTFYRVARTSFASVQNKAERRAVVKWYKIAKATGYQIQYSPSKTFSGDGTKTVNITKQSVTARTFGNLKKGRTLYFRIRTCKKVGTVIYRSAWSPLKKVTISK